VEVKEMLVACGVVVLPESNAIRAERLLRRSRDRRRDAKDRTCEHFRKLVDVRNVTARHYKGVAWIDRERIQSHDDIRCLVHKMTAVLACYEPTGPTW
jgi:hypothetical protein